MILLYRLSLFEIDCESPNSWDLLCNLPASRVNQISAREPYRSMPRKQSCRIPLILAMHMTDANAAALPLKIQTQWNVLIQSPPFFGLLRTHLVRAHLSKISLRPLKMIEPPSGLQYTAYSMR